MSIWMRSDNKIYVVDLSIDFTELMTDREGDVRTRTLHQISVQAQKYDEYT